MIRQPYRGFPIVLCPDHGWLPAFYLGRPTDRCPLCRLFADPERGWVAHELHDRGTPLADLAAFAVTGRWPEETTDVGGD